MRLCEGWSTIGAKETFLRDMSMVLRKLRDDTKALPTLKYSLSWVLSTPKGWARKRGIDFGRSLPGLFPRKQDKRGCEIGGKLNSPVFHPPAPCPPRFAFCAVHHSPEVALTLAQFLPYFYTPKILRLMRLEIALLSLEPRRACCERRFAGLPCLSVGFASMSLFRACGSPLGQR